MERKEALIKSLLISLSFILFSTAAGEGASEYFLLYNAQSASMLNRFQQRLSSDEQMMFKGCVPMQIVHKNETLGDEITTAHRVLFRGQTFFLIVNKLPETFKATIKPVDTIKISHSDVSLFENPDGSGRYQPLLEDEEYIRLITHKGYTYLFQTNPGKKSGWAKLMPSSWKKSEKKVLETSLTSVKLSHSEKDRIVELIDNANKAYLEYFEFFNSKTGKDTSVPKWFYELSESSISCKFNGSDKIFNGLNSSNEILVHNISNVLLGRPFIVELKDRSIIVMPKTPLAPLFSEQKRGDE